jgi:RNA recognition motif-containing protein
MYEGQEGQQPVEQTNKLFIWNLPWGVKEEDVTELFSAYGEVTSAKVSIDRETGRSKGFGFVEFKNLEDAIKAQADANGWEISGRNIKVEFAKPMEKREFSRPRNQY